MMDLFQYSFFQNALIGIALISVMSAVVGTYIVTRRMVFIAGGITHTCFGGLGLGYFLGWNPMLMAGVFAVGGSLGVDALARTNVRKDSAIAVIWALGMALGIMFVFLTKGYVPELNAFLFGNVLSITRADLWLFGGFAALILIVFAAFGPLIMAVSFDEDFARTRHLPVDCMNTAMTVLTAVGIVLATKMIGIMLLMSLISLPQLVAETFTQRYSNMMVLSGIVSLLSCVGGLWLSVVIDVPASAVIVILLTLVYATTYIIKYSFIRPRSSRTKKAEAKRLRH